MFALNNVLLPCIHEQKQLIHTLKFLKMTHSKRYILNWSSNYEKESRLVLLPLSSSEY